MPCESVQISLGNVRVKKLSDYSHARLSDPLGEINYNITCVLIIECFLNFFLMGCLLLTSETRVPMTIV